MANILPSVVVEDVAGTSDVVTQPAAPPGAVPVYNVPRPGTPPRKTINSITVYGHSNLLYWWPVWLVSFVLAGVTYAEGRQMAVVPVGTTVARVDLEGQSREALVAPAGTDFQSDRGGRFGAAEMTVSSNNSLGVIFVATLLIVAVASTILLRGLVSVIVVISLITLVILFSLWGWWNMILWELGRLDIRMNAAGYLAVAIPLFLAWVAVIFVYDRQTYIVFDSGQLRYVREVGDSEVVVQTEGAVVEKKAQRLFPPLAARIRQRGHPGAERGDGGCDDRTGERAERSPEVDSHQSDAEGKGDHGGHGVSNANRPIDA